MLIRKKKHFLSVSLKKNNCHCIQGKIYKYLEEPPPRFAIEKVSVSGKARGIGCFGYNSCPVQNPLQPVPVKGRGTIPSLIQVLNVLLVKQVITSNEFLSKQWRILWRNMLPSSALSDWTLTHHKSFLPQRNVEVEQETVIPSLVCF